MPGLASFGVIHALFIGMQTKSITIPEIALIGGTRFALGVGVGLLLSRRLNSFQSKGAGLALVAFGALTTIPLALEIAGKPAVVSDGASRAA
jgi:hypothetical protein